MFKHHHNDKHSHSHIHDNKHKANGTVLSFTIKSSMYERGQYHDKKELHSNRYATARGLKRGQDEIDVDNYDEDEGEKRKRSKMEKGDELSHPAIVNKLIPANKDGYNDNDNDDGDEDNDMNNTGDGNSNAINRSSRIIIPLQVKNHWFNNLEADLGNNLNQNEETGELLSHKDSNDQDIPSFKLNTNHSIPIPNSANQTTKSKLSSFNGTVLSMNSIPQNNNNNEDTRFHYDISLRPSAPSPNSSVYDRIPIEEFGAAMLRGMGWKGENDSIRPSGKYNNSINQPIPRPERLGLGAKQNIVQNKNSNMRNLNQIHTNRSDYKKQETDNKKRTREEEEKYNNRYESNHYNSSNTNTNINININSDRENERNRIYLDSNRKVSDVTSVISSSSSSSSASSVSDILVWCRPGIRVRIINRLYGDELYLAKANVIKHSNQQINQIHNASNINHRHRNRHLMNISDDFSFDLQLSDGQIIYSVSMKDLETVIPKSEGAQVTILTPNKWQGKIGIIIKRDDKHNIATVKIGNHTRENHLVKEKSEPMNQAENKGESEEKDGECSIIQVKFDEVAECVAFD